MRSSGRLVGRLITYFERCDRYLECSRYLQNCQTYRLEISHGYSFHDVDALAPKERILPTITRCWWEKPKRGPWNQVAKNKTDKRT